MVYVGALDGNLRALDEQTGKELWRFKANGGIFSGPLIADGTLYFASDNSTYYALDVATQQVKWQIDAEARTLWGVALDNGSVYFAGQGLITALDTATGENKFSLKLGDFWYPFTVIDGVFYGGSNDGYFYALDGQTGQEIWKFKSADSEPAWSGPVVVKDAVYVGSSDKHVYALGRQTGKEVWRFEVEDSATTDLVLADGVLLVGVGNHQNEEGKRHLYAIEAETGDQLWTFEAASRILAAPAVSDNAVYIVTIAGQVYALR
jgi:eukaryotic-like serine/threonine-protein kinase